MRGKSSSRSLRVSPLTSRSVVDCFSCLSRSFPDILAWAGGLVSGEGGVLSVAPLTRGPSDGRIQARLPIRRPKEPWLCPWWRRRVEEEEEVGGGGGGGEANSLASLS